ncbi:SDR family oxidoreductase [Neptunitalea lumnitzerae]|uniref:3-beta hydroxysteroid dehydrogenase n=1 Tax=Neptunitalea lumnitzerae TaxID=2965509 RepID=A0ABQ5MKW9_9FLAO|nr:SDR family oxidoreductase [Neptunitalea sp. Y10]GLB50019.1 3-beta hydroxysteroid dehydrogenase [Neptunitalea sp. Y10]
MIPKKVLVAGATGYLGTYITLLLPKMGYKTVALVRNKQKIAFKNKDIILKEAEVTQPETLKDSCKNIDYVISTIGITRQKDGLTYMDVDYQANVNLIEEAKKSGVKKFIYVSVFKGNQLTQTKICEAKEKLVTYLKNSGLDYCIIRPNGFFSDMGDFLSMAKMGKVYLFGNGTLKLNPIHGADLAEICITAIKDKSKEINIGGPQIVSQNEIGKLALNTYGKKEKIIHLPDWIRKLTLWSLRTFSTPKVYGPYEFFLTTMNIDMVAPTYGKHTLKEYFKEKSQAT